MEITPEQLEALGSGKTISVEINKAKFVVLPQESFDEMRKLIEEAELRSVFARAVESSDWNDPSMDVYDDYDNAKR